MVSITITTDHELSDVDAPDVLLGSFGIALWTGAPHLRVQPLLDAPVNDDDNEGVR